MDLSHATPAAGLAKFGLPASPRAAYDAAGLPKREMLRPTSPPGQLEKRADTTCDLVQRAQAGDQAALEAVFARVIPSLRRWARGRLPAFARDGNDTQDLVQDAVTNVFRRLDTFEYRHDGALQAYLRQAVNNRILDEVRRAQRRPGRIELGDDSPDQAPSALQQTIGREGVERYEAALQRLRPSDREAVIARVELQQSYEEIAVALQKPSPNAARLAVIRALARLVREMDRPSRAVTR